MESQNPALETPSDNAVARYVQKTGMATKEQVAAALKLAPLPLAEALVRNGVITSLQREAVESTASLSCPIRESAISGCPRN